MLAVLSILFLRGSTSSSRSLALPFPFVLAPASAIACPFAVEFACISVLPSDLFVSLASTSLHAPRNASSYSAMYPSKNTAARCLTGPEGLRFAIAARSSPVTLSSVTWETTLASALRSLGSSFESSVGSRRARAHWTSTQLIVSDTGFARARRFEDEGGGGGGLRWARRARG